MGKFSVKATNTGFTFCLKAGNSETIAVSEVYSSKASCLNGIKSVSENAGIANVEDQTADNFKKESCPKFEVYKDKKGEFRFRLVARNGQTIAASEGYTTKQSCLNGIESVRKNASSEIVEQA